MTKESLFHMCDTIRIIPANAQFSLYFPEYLFLQMVFWQQERASRNIHLFSASVPMQGIAKLLSRMSPVNWALELIFQYALNPSGRSCPSGGSLSVLWPGSTILAVFPKIMRYLSILLLFIRASSANWNLRNNYIPTIFLTVFAVLIVSLPLMFALAVFGHQFVF